MIKGAEGAVSSMISLLQANLPTEFNLIDAEMADGLTLDDVDAGAYFDYENDVTLIEHGAAIVVNALSTGPVQIDSIVNTPGRDVSEHAIEVFYHLKDTANETPSTTKLRVLRAARAIVRVLAIKNATVESTGRTMQFFREGDATYIIDGQVSGEYTRSARIPFRVRTVEIL